MKRKTRATARRAVAEKRNVEAKKAPSKAQAQGQRAQAAVAKNLAASKPAKPAPKARPADADVDGIPAFLKRDKNNQSQVTKPLPKSAADKLAAFVAKAKANGLTADTPRVGKAQGKVAPMPPNANTVRRALASGSPISRRDVYIGMRVRPLDLKTGKPGRVVVTVQPKSPDEPCFNDPNFIATEEFIIHVDDVVAA